MRPILVGFLTALVATTPSLAQNAPLTPVRESGQTVTPVFEGWYRNPDGTFSISFGYLNRNSSERLDVPIGRANFISPGDPNQGQPTHFAPRRHWGVFVVRVPADFGTKTVTWTLVFRGDSVAIPGSLKPNWEIDALKGEVGSGNTPPEVRFDSAGASGAGPGGVMGAPRTARVGVPMTLTVWATDNSLSRGNTAGAAAAAGAGAGRAGTGRGAAPITFTWFKHQGPGLVTFTPPTPPFDRASGQATTSVTFAEPGTFILRVRLNDASGVAGAGHAQCCWTNGFIRVTVSN